MDNSLYQDIFKRKSFHLFGNLKEKIPPQDLKEILSFISRVDHLYPDIRIIADVVPASENKRSRGEEYAIIFYSEEKDNYLTNIGYIGEQIDLFLASKDIGSLWYGMGKPKKTVKGGLKYVIMLLFGKKDKAEFRKDMYASKRKPLAEIWEGEQYPFSNIVRFAPSACNTQNWLVENRDKRLSVYRIKHTRFGIMPRNKVTYYNQIDIGIFLCFLELCLNQEKIAFSRTLFIDSGQAENTLVAYYSLC